MPITITLWLLLSTNGATIDQFLTEKDCDATLAQMESKSMAKANMPTVRGVCVPATVIRFLPAQSKPHPSV